MTRRMTAGALLALAAAAWFGFVAPARGLRDRARREYTRLRQERERLRRELAAVARRTRDVPAPEGAAAAARAVRLVLLHATAGLPLQDVQIAASGEARGTSTRGRLSAEGRQADLLRLADRLSEAGSGFQVLRVRLAGASDGRAGRRRIEIEGRNSRDAS